MLTGKQNEMMKSNLLILGKVVGTHGIRGELKIHSSSGPSESLLNQKEVFFRDPRGREVCRWIVRMARQHKNTMLLALEGVHTADDAVQFVGKEILIERAKLPPLPEGEYYWFQIQGLRVETREGHYIGRIEQLILTGANDVYVVSTSGGEILLPAVEDVIHRIDLERGTMVVDLPEGLTETDED